MTLSFVVAISLLRLVYQTIAGDNDVNMTSSLLINDAISEMMNADDEEMMTCFDETKLTETETLYRSVRSYRQLHEGTSRCRDLRRPTTTSSQPWQRHKTWQHEIVVYSAFYDERPSLGVKVWIRILGVASISSNDTIYCHVWYKDCPTPYIATSAVSVIGRGHGYVIDDNRYVQYMFSCLLPGTEPVPSHVSLVATDPCVSSSIFLPVERPIRSQPDHEFGVCVAIAFGNIPLAEFVEWIELNRMFGITEFNIYDAGMVNMSTVFEYYIKQRILRVHQMPPPVAVMRSSNDTVPLIKV